MSIEIPRNIVADHVVFDRIVDADRTIQLAREAAEEAAAAGKQDVADMLNAKADALEKILLATQHPDYSDEEEPAGSGDEGTGKGNNSGSDQQDDNEGDAENDTSDKDKSENGNGGQGENGDPEAENGGQGENGDPEAENGGKTPEDIANLSNVSDHSDGTQHIGPSSGGGSGKSSGSDSGSGGGGASGNGKGKDFDPFRMKKGEGGGQQKQPTPEEILAAVIKRLKGLSGNAKTGADRALRKLFDELGGTGDIDD